MGIAPAASGYPFRSDDQTTTKKRKRDDTTSFNRLMSRRLMQGLETDHQIAPVTSIPIPSTNDDGHGDYFSQDLLALIDFNEMPSSPERDTSIPISSTKDAAADDVIEDMFLLFDFDGMCSAETRFDDHTVTGEGDDDVIQDMLLLFDFDGMCSAETPFDDPTVTGDDDDDDDDETTQGFLALFEF